MDSTASMPTNGPSGAVHSPYRKDLMWDLCAALEGGGYTTESSNAVAVATCARLDNVPDPELSVEGVGKLQLPLDPAQARALIQLSRLAPFGKAAATIVDTRVRFTWEISPEKLSFGSQAWGEYIRGVATAAVKQMGFQAAFRHELYKMLIYEKGAMFKAHTE